MPHRGLSTLVRSLRSLGALLLGYVTLIVGTTLVQETLLGGVSYQTSPAAMLVVGGLLTPLAAIAAGAVSGFLAAARPLWHVLPIVLAIAIESSVLYRTGRVDGPLWYEALAAAALMAGVILGAGLVGRLRRST